MKRVKLIHITEDWFDQLIQWRSQPEAQEHQPISSMSKEQLRHYLKSRRSSKWTDLADHDYILIIVDQERNEGVGWITLEIMSRRHGLARIGYTIDKHSWNQGYATAAVDAIIQLLFNNTTIERIEADCSVHNPASQRVLEKCGFHYIGTKRSYLVIKGERVDHHYFELCKKDLTG